MRVCVAGGRVADDDTRRLSALKEGAEGKGRVVRPCRSPTHGPCARPAATEGRPTPCSIPNGHGGAAWARHAALAVAGGGRPAGRRARGAGGGCRGGLLLLASHESEGGWRQAQGGLVGPSDSHNPCIHTHAM